MNFRQPIRNFSFYNNLSPNLDIVPFSIYFSHPIKPKTYRYHVTLSKLMTVAQKTLIYLDPELTKLCRQRSMLVLWIVTCLTLAIKSCSSTEGTQNATINAEIIKHHPKPPIDPLAPTTYNGDVLNVTKCYCLDPYETRRKGYYFQYDYYNWHSNKYFTVHRTCDSRKHALGVGLGRFPFCWGDEGFDKWRKTCGYQTKPHAFPGDHKDKFCVRLGMSLIESPTWTNTDSYYFNDQKRTLTVDIENWFAIDNSVCRQYCPRYLKRTVMAEDDPGSGSIWVPGTTFGFYLNSSVSIYTELDDMCHDCR